MIFSVQFRVISEHNCLALSRVKYGPLCPICYHLCNLKNEKSTHGGLLYLIKLQAKVCNSTKSNTPPLVFFTFLKLYKCYQIAQSISYFIIVHNVSGLWLAEGTWIFDKSSNMKNCQFLSLLRERISRDLRQAFDWVEAETPAIIFYVKFLQTSRNF